MVFKQPDLSLFNIAVYTILQTLIWLYLWYNPRQQMRTRRWQTWWQLMGYGGLWSIGCYAMYHEALLDIFGHITDVWHWPAMASAASRAYFEMEIAWYISQLFTLAIDRSLKDYYVMLFHHVITPVEIFYSYDCGYAAIGMTIMFLHDTSDVCLHVAKTLHNAELKLLTDAAFVTFAALFALTRLVLLPMCPYAYFTGDAEHQSFCGHMLAGTCSVLVVLHCYWFYLIVRMIRRFARAGKVEGDIREPGVVHKPRNSITPVNGTVNGAANGASNGAENGHATHATTKSASLKQRKVEKIETKSELQ